MSVNDVRNSIQQVKTETERIQGNLEDARRTLGQSQAALDETLDGSHADEAHQIIHGLSEAETLIGRGRDLIQQSMQQTEDYERRL